MTQQTSSPLELLLDTPLLAGARHLDAPAVVGGDRPWSWREIHEASIAFGRQLGDATIVCNLCNSRAAFLVTLLAALRRHRLTVLPPSGGNADLSGILQTTRKPVIVVDDPRSIQPSWRDAADCLVWTPTPAAAAASAGALRWEPAWHETGVLLYTSGSTGAPEAQPKTLLQLCTGALVLGARLQNDVDGGLAAIQRIICSVPPQHMFGVEASVMLSLVHAVPVLDGRPLLPADVQDAFAQAPPAAWVATPLHLRSLVQTDAALLQCRLVVASTMPLTQALAHEAEARVQAPVLEIYGSTETGVLAMRRTAQEADWLPMRDVHIASVDGGAIATGSHFSSPVKLPDEVEFGTSGRFVLRGRQADLIKIAGRRASLAGLNLLLQDLPGLVDGVFYLPATGSPTERLCLICVSPTLDRAAITQWLRTRLDPVFMPRTIIHVDRLPRSDNGKLPRQALDAVYATWKTGARRPS